MDISIKFTDPEIPKFKGEKYLDAAPWHRIDGWNTSPPTFLN
jgi:hypothetical protein